MSRYAVIRANVIINLIEWDGTTPWTPPPNTEVERTDLPCSIGWTWNNGHPVDPNPPPVVVMPSSSEKDDNARALIARRIEDLDKGNVKDQLEALRLRFSLLR